MEVRSPCQLETRCSKSLGYTSTLIKNSKEIFNSVGIDDLKKAGIQREDIKTSSHSHRIVTYPHITSLRDVNLREVYSKENPSALKEFELYLHLPFCTGKCTYCDYVTLSNQPSLFIDSYITALEKEVSLLHKIQKEIKNATVNSVFIGGGTPTYLTSDQLNRIMVLLKTKFSIKETAEITVEIGPETVMGLDGTKKLNTLYKNGVNRLSIGFQTFDDHILHTVGRRHNSRDAVIAFNSAKDIGFNNINIDLIPGLPDGSLESWENDLNKASSLEPTSVTCYPLSIKRNALIWPVYNTERERFPSNDDVVLMQIMANEFFNNLGYIQLPAGWFVMYPTKKQPTYKFTKSNNQLALGVSTYSFVNGFQYFNFHKIYDYMASTERGILPVSKGIKLSKEDLMKRFIIFDLKVGLDERIFYERFGVKPRDVFKKTWAKLDKLGLIEQRGSVIDLSYTGKIFADEVCREFYLDEIKILEGS